MSGSVTVAERRTRAMGSAVHVVVVSERDRAGALADRAVARVAGLEARWSRFRDDSELSRINAADGAPCLVSDDTAALVGSLRDAWVTTAGRFDPTVSVARLGYTTSFDTLNPPISGLPTSGAARVDRGFVAPGCADVEVDRSLGLVRVPAGVTLDAGGLGKGLAADLVADGTMRAGAAGVLVNVGGDVAVAGTPLGGGPWTLSIEAPDGDRHDPDPHDRDSDEVGRVVLAAGGVATSTSARRRWRDATGAVVHHLLDPVTGRPAVSERRQVTVVAASARDAEVAAKCVFLDGVLPALARTALVVDAWGAVTTLGGDSDVRFWIATPVGGDPR